MVKPSRANLLVFVASMLQRPGGPWVAGEAFQLRTVLRSPKARAITTARRSSSSSPRKSWNVHTDSVIPLQFILADASDSSNSIQSFAYNTDFWVFVVGIFPFAWATVEFWRRIAVGASFGTGKDSIVIGMDDSPADSRGRRVLGKGALAIAVVLFTLAFATIVIVLFSVVTSDAPPEVFPSATTSSVVEGMTALQQ